MRDNPLIISGSWLFTNDRRELITKIWPDFEFYLQQQEGLFFDYWQTNLEDIIFPPTEIVPSGELGQTEMPLEKKKELLQRSRSNFINLTDSFRARSDPTNSYWQPCLELRYASYKNSIRDVVMVQLFSHQYKQKRTPHQLQQPYDASSLVVRVQHGSPAHHDGVLMRMYMHYHELRKKYRSMPSSGELSIAPQVQLAGAVSADPIEDGRLSNS